ncbi:MAG TPA: hypothetical protein VFG50_14980 [Rhodothermales bacterium]|nr:hypothetical protein [Rhodothermales bacterium]
MTSAGFLWRCSLCALAGMLGVLALLLTGCEEDVTVSLGTDRAYSLYGYMNPIADTQWIRVYPITGQLHPTSPEPLDAHFTSTDVQANEVRVWRDSTLHFPDSTYEHVFWSPFRAEYDHTYRIEVKRSDGATSSVEVATPSLVYPVAQRPVIDYTVRLPVTVDGAVPRLFNIAAEYLLLLGRNPDGTRRFSRCNVSYDDQIQDKGDHWLVNVNLKRDFQHLADSLHKRGEYSPEFGMYITLLTFRVDVVNEEWAPLGGSFDPEKLIQPGTFTNVKNGFGFVGAGYQRRIPLLTHDEFDPLEQEAERAAGFKPCPCPPG